MLALATVLFVLTVGIMAVSVGLHGLWRVLVGRSPRWDGAPRWMIRAEGLARLALFPIWLWLAFVAAPIAERRVEWVDADDNGILDGFSNVDWMDHTAGEWSEVWALLLVILVVAAAVVWVGIDRIMLAMSGEQRGSTDQTGAGSAHGQ